MTTTTSATYDPYVSAAKIAYKMARESLPRYAHSKSPHFFTFHQLGACALLRSILRISYRDMQNYLQENVSLQRALELRSIPDYSTLMRAEQKMGSLFHVIRGKYISLLESEALLGIN
jgi:hypothetical protein